MRRRVAGRHQAIVEAALAAFSRTGFSATQIADIARRAGVSTGALYLYAESKEALFQAAFGLASGAAPVEADSPLAFHGWDALQKRLRKWTKGPVIWPRLSAAVKAKAPPKGGDVRAVVTEFYDLIAANRRLLRLIDVSARDVPELANIYEAGIKRRLIADMEVFAARRLGKASPVAARAVTELITWMAMHRHGDTQPIRADEDDIRAGAIVAAARSLDG